MKAVILAGGKGSRGKPYTEYFPKAMIPINGKPLIDYLVKYLGNSQLIDEIIIVADFKGLGGQIKNYYDAHSRFKKIIFVQDSQRGTGGDLLHLKNHLKGETEFLLWFVDNLCAVNVNDMKKFFKEKNSMVCIATRDKKKEETGFAIVEDGIIKKFIEKPVINLTMPECLGIYILSKKVLKIIQSKSKQKSINLSFDVLQDLAKDHKISAYDIDGKEWIDVESPTILERNENRVKKIIKQMEL